MVRAALATMVLLAVAQGVSADEPRVRVLHVDTPPVIDGRLDEALYDTPPQIDGLTMVEPVSGGEPTQHTQVWIFTTPTHLYVSFRSHDTDPSGIVAQRMLRDESVIPDDRVSFSIGPYGDRRNGYFFQVNPNAVRRDVLLEGETFETNWDGFWRAKASIDEGGWNAEMAIPYQTLSFDENVAVWDFNVERVVRRTGERQRWVDDRPDRFILEVGIGGYLTDMRGLEQGLGLELVPTFTSRIIADPDGSDDWENEPSGDVFYKITPSLTASATVKTDFGETEVDNRQVNLTRFPLFFPEKREFFLEDGLIFDFGGLEEDDIPFFSRRVGLDENREEVGILTAGKLTGRVGPMKIGVLHSQMEESRGPNTDKSLSVVRTAFNVFGASTVGAILTNGDPTGETDNTLVGADFNYRESEFFPRRTLEGSLWVQNSFSRNSAPTREDGNDELAFGGRLSYPNDIWSWVVEAREVQKNFNPALGFVRRTGVRRYVGTLRHRHRWDGWLRTWDKEVEVEVFMNRRDRVDTATVIAIPVELITDVEDSMRLLYRHDFEKPLDDFDLDGGLVVVENEYHFDAVELRLTASEHRPLSGEVRARAGTFFDGYQTRLDTDMAWRPSKHFLVSPTYELRYLRGIGGKGDTIHLARLRVNLQFTTDISWVTFTQWDSLSDTLGINTRFRWIIEDGREIFLVLNQGIRTLKGEDGRGITEPLIKVEWAFRF